MTATVSSALAGAGTATGGDPGTGLDALLAPRGVAVIGASRDPGKLGAVMARSLKAFPGHLALVNARAGFETSVRQAAVRGPIDLAVLCVPAAASAAALREAADGGARAAVVCGGGFAEAGPEGARLQHELAVAAADTGIRVLGPNTSGVLVPALGLRASFVPGVSQVPTGRVAVVATSGGVNHALAFALTAAGAGVSLAVGLGNAVDVGAADLLEHLARDDGGTRAVALHVESVRDAPRLLAAARVLTERCPVVALVVGRNDVAAFAASHTGALASSWRTTRAALRQSGVVLVDDERELVDAVTTLSAVRARPGARTVGVLTAQAGPGLLLLDDLRGRRLPVPELSAGTRARLAGLLPPLTYQANPVDTGRPDPSFGPVLAAVAADAGIDVVAAYALHEPDALDLPAAVEQARSAGPLTLVAGVGGVGPGPEAVRAALRERGVAALADARGVAAAIAALLADAAGQRRAAPSNDGADRAGPGGGAGTAVVPLPGSGAWDEDRAKALVQALGVRTPARRVCASRAAAHTALVAVGGPVAVKLLDASVLHKTEIGGVHLDVRDPEGLDRALDALERVGARRFLVEAMAPAGVDLVVGARRDPVFGPVVLVGLGGTVAEALADVAVRLAPLDVEEAAATIDELAGRLLVEGWRGGPVLDRAELGRVVAGLGDLLVAHPRLQEVEVNPLRVTADGLVALDALVREVSDD